MQKYVRFPVSVIRSLVSYVPIVWLSCCIGCIGVAHAAQQTDERDTLLVAIGAAGADEFEGEFESWAQPWQKLAQENQWNLKVIDAELDGKSPREQMQQAIESHAGSTSRLWLVMLGHGTYANGVAKFNLPGPDVATGDLQSWLGNVNGEVVVVGCFSASAPFLTELAGSKRVVVSATRSGSEVNFARFGKFLAECVTDLSSDIDHDESVSLLEAFIAAGSRTERFYADASRLATEHALLDDNGDKAGTPGDFFVGVQASKVAKDGKPTDGMQAARLILFASPNALKMTQEQEAARDSIEAELDALRAQKSKLESDAYYAQLEPLMLKLAKLYEAAEGSAKPSE